jgi:translation initiation factor 5A
MSKIFQQAKELKVGKYVLIDDIPCRVVGIDSSKPGKHGAAKMRVVAMGVFDDQKKTLLIPSDADVEVPIIERKTAQIISVSGDTGQLMDTETYEIYSLTIPKDLLPLASAGKEVEIMEAMEKRTIIRIK